MVLAHECGLASRLETLTLRPSPIQVNPDLSMQNPLSKIPVLVTDEGLSLYDSPVICEYLDSLHRNRKMVPEAGGERWKTLRTQALCDGLLEAAIQVFYEKLHRPRELQWQEWLRGQSEKAQQGLDQLEAECSEFSQGVDLGQIAAAVTLGWLEFRDVFGDIRSARPQLFDWYESFRQRPSMKSTEPHG